MAVTGQQGIPQATPDSFVEAASGITSKGTGRPDRGTDSKSRAASLPLLGRVFQGRYRIIQRIGEGGMGAVYRAEQVCLGRTCAVKILTKLDSRRPGDNPAKRFFLEAAVASRLAHPNTVRVFDFGSTDDGICFIAMEYLQGRTLQSVLLHEGPMPEARMIRVAQQVAKSLREAHDMGVIHRDLKPSNVFLLQSGDESDFVKVFDFGLAKRLDPEQDEGITYCGGMVLGTPWYMSPEQATGSAVDPRTDVYSLGINMYEMMTGAPPFRRSSTVKVMLAHVDDPVPPMKRMFPGIQVSPAVEAVVLKCLKKDPDDRFQSMQQVLDALDAAVAQRPQRRSETHNCTSIRPVVASAPPPPVARSDNLLRVVLAAVASFVLLSLGAMAFVNQNVGSAPNSGVDMSLGDPAQTDTSPEDTTRASAADGAADPTKGPEAKGTGHRIGLGAKALVENVSSKRITLRAGAKRPSSVSDGKGSRTRHFDEPRRYKVVPY